MSIQSSGIRTTRMRGRNAVVNEEKLKIAMLGHKRVPSREGGIEIVVEELASRRVAEGHEVTCYNRRGHHVSGAEFDGERVDIYKGIKIKTVPTIERKGLAAMTSSFFASLFVAVGNVWAKFLVRENDKKNHLEIDTLDGYKENATCRFT